MEQIHTYIHKSFIEKMTERINLTIRENTELYTMKIIKTKNNTLADMIWMKEHTVNKIPIIVSVSQFKIMTSGPQVITVISLSG